MAETNHTDTTKPDNSLVWVKINLPYFRTPAGMIKILQLLLGIICMACASPALLDGTHWFLFVAVISFIATLVWVFIYLLSIREALTLPINWHLTELVNTGLLAILYLIAFIVQLSIWGPTNYIHRAPNIAAGVFGLLNTIAYAAGAYLIYKDWKTLPTNQ